MSNNGNGNGKLTLTRRDFLKATAAAGAAGGVLTMAEGFQNAAAVPSTDVIDHSVTTVCQCCGVGCGQVVDLDASGNIIDVHGDPNHMTNRGGNCAKGAATVQWVNGDRRLGTPENAVGIHGPVYRDGNNDWSAYASWDSAITDIATRLVSARGSVSAPAYHSKSVAFLGSAHLTNEDNYLYRKLIANFGTNGIEHQARI